MAAYAALVSLSNILHQILHPPPTHHFIYPREEIESLQEKANFLIDFLETYSGRRSQEIEDLEKRIADAAYAAEDLIESDVVSQILAKYAIHVENKGSALFQEVSKKKDTREGMLEVLEKFTSIEKELVKIENRTGMEDVGPKNTTGASSLRHLPSGKNIMIGFDEHLIQIKTALASYESSRQIVPVVGMGGIGKTTLATSVYKDPFIIEHFEIRVWVSVSQGYTEREIVLVLLHQIDSNIDHKKQELSVDELGILLYKILFERRYLIILDDIWNIEIWDKLKRFLPPNSNGSRILVTTRLINLAVDFECCSPYQIGLLNVENSWALILDKVFAKEECPIELVGIGKSIARKCEGLPLALVAIGGLLAKSKKTRESWKNVEEDVTSAVNYENDEHCIKILSLSYNHLPVHLKPCFLYLAMFPKYFQIRVSVLIRLWVAEGIIKPSRGKSFEEIAEKYLEDLFDRNLIMVGKRGHSGKVKTISIHDLIRDLCKREAHKDKFLRIAKLDNPEIPHMENERRLSIHVGTRKEKVCEVLRSATLNRSFLAYSRWESKRCIARGPNLLRVLHAVDTYTMEEILQLTNSRYITCGIPWLLHRVSSFMSLFWNLQTLVVPGLLSLSSEIWQMPQLRHLKIAQITLPDPPDIQVDNQSIIVLENLQTLSTVNDFIFRAHVLKRIPNLRKLGVRCRTTEKIRSFCLSNLVSLRKLESLVLAYHGTWEKITFPVSLKKLTLNSCRIPWDDMSAVGSLPNLEVLKLQKNAATGRNWNPNAGEFCRLKFLSIDSCDLQFWGADESHFPSLEHLHISQSKLKEISMDFAQIPTLQMMELYYCKDSLILSAKKMSKERENLGYEEIEIRSSLKIVIKVSMNDDKCRSKALTIVADMPGVESVALTGPEKNQVEVVGGEIDVVTLTRQLRRNVGYSELVSVGINRI